MPAKQIELGHDIIRAALEVGATLRYDSTNDEHVCVASLYSSIVELYASCIALAETDRPGGIPIVLRSMYEALIELQNLLTDRAYFQYMQAANLKQMCKLLEQSATNPLLAGLSTVRDVPRDLATLQAQRQELAAKGIKSLSIEQRCEQAGRIDQYNSLYALFCLDSHNNIAALEDRHVERSAQHTIVSMFAPTHVPNVRRRLSFGAGFVLEAAGMMRAAFKLEVPSIDDLAKRQNAMAAELGKAGA